MIINSLILIFCNFFFVYFAINKLIYISHKKNLFDEPSEIRKIHLHKTPNLGGVAIFISLLLSGCFFYSNQPFIHLNYLLGAAIIIFGLGLTDDLLGVDPVKKLLTQLIVAVLVASTTSLHFDHGLQSLLGIHHLPYGVGVLISSFFILFMMNALNLIDGIDGLAGSIALLSGVIFSVLFWRMNDGFFFQMSVALCGCLAGFLYFNFTPAKIFMGDTGSLFIGFLLAIFSIRFLESNALSQQPFEGILFSSPVPLVYALLVVPVFDTVRIIITRLLNKKSPFEADRNHIHHVLIDQGLTHMQATSILIVANISAILISFLLTTLNPLISILIMTLYTSGLFSLVHIFRKQRSKRETIVPDMNYPISKLRGFTILTPRKLNVKNEASEMEEVSN